MPGTQPSRRVSILLGPVSKSIPYPLIEEQNVNLEERNVSSNQSTTSFTVAGTGSSFAASRRSVI